MENKDWQKTFLDKGTELGFSDLSMMISTVSGIVAQAHQAGIQEAVEKLRMEKMTDEERKGDSKERRIAQMYYNYAIDELNNRVKKLE